ncbi:MAG: PilZ domain-containing protein [Thiobacillus sp.]|nr:PilZ domain-containing protein [Thiobacillus sp.]
MNTNASPAGTRRQFSRIEFDAGVVLNTFPGRHECRLVDISLKGALVERLLTWQVRLGDPCSLVVHLSENGPAIHMAGEIAHVEQGRLGMHCTDIDLESVTNLRRLVELNLGDETALQRELSAMVGIDAAGRLSAPT